MTPSLVRIEGVLASVSTVVALAATVALGAALVTAQPVSSAGLVPVGDVDLRLAGPSGHHAPSARPGSPSVAAAPSMPPAPSVHGAGPAGARQIDRRALDVLIQSSDLLSDVTPMSDRGVRVARTSKAGALELLGIQPGDVIRSVNGRAPGPDATLASTLTRAAGSGMLRLEVERAGRHDVRYIRIVP